MHDHAGGLVDHEQVLVLVHDLERNVFRFYIAAGRGRNLDVDRFARFQLVARLLPTAGDGHVAICNQRRRLRAREATLLRDQRIEAPVATCLERERDALCQETSLEPVVSGGGVAAAALAAS